MTLYNIETVDELPLMRELVSTAVEMGLTQPHMASRLGWSQWKVSSFERWTSDPRLSDLAAYADALGFKITLTPKEIA